MRRSRANETAKAAKTKPTTRCAICTRKSSDEGLDQEFNSLDAQRDAAEAYIVSQKAEGWTALAERYDDGGYSGGSMERPALDRLLRDIERGKVDCVIVYNPYRPVEVRAFMNGVSCSSYMCRGLSTANGSTRGIRCR